MEPVRIPITEEKHRNRRRVVAVSVVVIVVSMSVFFALSLNSVATTNVMGVQVHIEYLGNSSGYFGPVVQNFTWNFKTLTPGESFHFSFELTNRGSATHVVRFLGTGSGGFDLISSTPASPFSISSNSSQNILLTIEPPSQGFVGDLQIYLSAS
jgi:hypothetical protein